MKHTIIISMLTLLAFPLLAQPPVIKAYAYSRLTIPGIRPAVVDESKSPTGQISSPFPPTYYFYLEVKRGAAIQVDGLWLKQRFYQASLKEVTPPVLLSKQAGITGKGQKETLVAKSNHDVYEVQLGKESNREPAAPLELEQSQKNEVVFVLSSNKKLSYAAVVKIKELQPNAAP